MALIELCEHIGSKHASNRPATYTILITSFPLLQIMHTPPIQHPRNYTHAHARHTHAHTHLPHCGGGLPLSREAVRMGVREVVSAAHQKNQVRPCNNSAFRKASLKTKESNPRRNQQGVKMTERGGPDVAGSRAVSKLR